MTIFEVFGCFRLLKCNNWWFKQFIVMYLHEICPLICPNRTLRSDFMTKKLPKIAHCVWDTYINFSHKWPYISKSKGSGLLETI